MSSGGEMNLTILPSDVIRNLISVTEESLHSIRAVRLIRFIFFRINHFLIYLFTLYFIPQISRRWNNLCMDHLTQRKQIPSIESVYFHRDLLDQKTIKICMKKKYQKYLETMKYRILSSSNTSDVIIFFFGNSQYLFSVNWIISSIPIWLQCFQVKTEIWYGFDFQKMPEYRKTRAEPRTYWLPRKKGRTTWNCGSFEKWKCKESGILENRLLLRGHRVRLFFLKILIIISIYFFYIFTVKMYSLRPEHALFHVSHSHPVIPGRLMGHYSKMGKVSLKITVQPISRGDAWNARSDILFYSAVKND